MEVHRGEGDGNRESGLWERRRHLLLRLGRAGVTGHGGRPAPRKGPSAYGTLAAFNPSNGQPGVARYACQGSVEGALTEVPGIVAVGTGPTVDLLSSSTGQVLFSYTEATQPPPPKGVGYGAPTGEFWAPPTIAGNTLYIANQDGSFRAFSP